MRWLRRDIWKAGIVLARLLLLLILMAWVPVSAVAYEGTAGLTTPATVQATPTEDATVTALKKEQLTQQVNQLDNWWLYWLYNGSAAFIAAFAAITVASFGIYQWSGNLKKDLKAQAEERFKTAVTALGNENEGTQVGGAILLRSFLKKEDKEIYGRHYTQIFDLAAAYLRLSSKPQPQDSDTPLPLTPLRLALVVIFKEAFPLARSQERRSPQSLDAIGVQLDNAYLSGSDLKQLWMASSSLRNAYLNGTDLSGARLRDCNFSGAELRRSDLRGTDFRRTILCHADLSGANLEGAILQGTDLRGVKGLDDTQLKVCEDKGAIIDKILKASPPQPPVAPSPPAQSTNLQGLPASPVPPHQGSIPSPDAGEGTSVSKQNNEAQTPSPPPAQVSTPPASTGGSSSTSTQPNTEP